MATQTMLSEAKAINLYADKQPRVTYVRLTGSDSNDGFSWATAKATIPSAIAALPSSSGMVILESDVTFTLGAGTSLDLDISKVRLKGDNTILKWSAVPTAGYAVWLYSSADFTNRTKLWGVNALEGISILGNDLGAGKYAATGVRVGNATYSNASTMIRWFLGGAQGWTYGLEFMSSAWNFRANGLNIRDCTYSIYQLDTVVNGGENMAFRECLLEGAIKVGSGDFQFTNCSIDNANIEVTGSSSVYVTGGHLENPAATSSQRYITINGGSGLVALSNTEIIIGAPSDTGVYGMSPFYVASSANHGLSLSNVRVPFHSWIQPQVAGENRCLVAGGGPVRATNLVGNIASQLALPTAAALNRLINGDFESSGSSAVGWTAGGSGSSLVSIETSTPRSGTRYARLSPTITLNTYLQQIIPVTPGQLVAWSMWIKYFHLNSGGIASAEIRWLDSTQVDIPSGAQAAYRSWAVDTTSWSASSHGAFAPPGTAYARLRLYVAAGSSGTPAYAEFDDVTFTAT